MKGHIPDAPKKNDYRVALRRYGYGVPNIWRALRSMKSDVTLVVENRMTPFKFEDSRIKTKDMILHDLPWPVDALESLGNAQVEMKVTLSYFIEPNPGMRGWTKRHRYQSYGLRFGAKRPEESLDEFKKRINRAAREQDENATAAGSDSGWMLGPIMRDRGSIHSDIWRGTALDLANRNGIAVYPLGGWWSEKRDLERYDQDIRYSLIVTLRVQKEADIYAEMQAKIPVESQAET